MLKEFISSFVISRCSVSCRLACGLVLGFSLSRVVIYHCTSQSILIVKILWCRLE